MTDVSAAMTHVVLIRFVGDEHGFVAKLRREHNDVDRAVSAWASMLYGLDCEITDRGPCCPTTRVVSTARLENEDE